MKQTIVLNLNASRLDHSWHHGATEVVTLCVPNFQITNLLKILMAANTVENQILARGIRQLLQMCNEGLMLSG